VHVVRSVVERVREPEVSGVAIPRRHVVVEDDQLAGDPEEISQDRVRGSDVDEYDLLALEVEQIDRILVAVRDVAGIVSPGSPHRPRRAEAVGTTPVIETPPLHGR